VSRPGLLVDDWGYAAGARFGGIWHLLWATGFSDNPRRPVAGVWYAAVFGAFDGHPVAHALALVALNAVAGGLVFLVARRIWGTGPGILTALAWAALPNRGSSRLWFSVGPTLLAVVLLLLGVLLLLDGRPVLSTVVLALAVLANETVVLLALLSVAVSYRTGRRSLSQATAAAAPLVVAAGYLWARSPKRETPLKFFSHAGNFVAAQLGRGNFGSERAAVVGGTVVLVAVVVALVVALRDRGGAPAAARMVAAGVGLLIVAAAPLLVIGFPFATDGIFDRGNLAPDLGMAVILGGLAACLWRQGPAPLGLLLALAVLAYLGFQNSVDLRDYERAVRQGDTLQRQLATDVPTIDAPLLIGPPLPSTGGVAQLLTDYDTSAALELHRHDPRILARLACTERDFEESSAEPLRYDRLRRTLDHRPSGRFDRAAFRRHC